MLLLTRKVCVLERVIAYITSSNTAAQKLLLKLKLLILIELKLYKNKNY